MTILDRSPFLPSLASALRDVKRQARAIREDKGLTQRDVAALIGSSQSQYAAWESDERRKDCHVSSIWRVAHVLGYRLEIRLVPRE